MNGKEAIERVLKKAEDKCCGNYIIIIMDINMPIMNGIEASQIIKKMANRNEIPSITMVAVSADPIEDKEKEIFYMKSGFIDYISKPTSKDKFISLLRKYKLL